MKIGVISDTHYPISCSALPDVIFDEFRYADIVLHCGDLVSLDLLKIMKKKLPKAEIKAVSGNMDSPEVKNTLPDKYILEAGKFRIGLTHGYGAADNMPAALKKIFSGQILDAILFGHTHTPFNKVIDNTLYFNPGSLCDKVFAEYNSYGILQIGDTIQGRIVRLEK